MTENKKTTYPTLAERKRFQEMEEQERDILFKKMTPEERSNISGFGSEDNPGYCDANGHCYSFEEDAKCADLYIKENEQLQEENKKLKEEVKKLTDFHTFMKNSQHSHANELAKERDLYESQRDEAIEEVKKLKEDMEDMYDEEGAKDCCEILGFVHEEDFAELQKGYKDTKKELHKLLQEKKKWEENEKGIMEYDTAGIHGCNSYERFEHAIAELNYSENWITELRYENKELKEEMKKMSS